MDNKIKVLKEKYHKEMEYYGDQVREHIKEYGPLPCDYLEHRKQMCHYFRGAYNALIELEGS